MYCIVYLSIYLFILHHLLARIRCELDQDQVKTLSSFISTTPPIRSLIIQRVCADVTLIVMINNLLETIYCVTVYIALCGNMFQSLIVFGKKRICVNF